ncbi:MAG TPA: ureidoglycolate lyase [Chloroflexota bacterium]|jgi:ureidoglycolate hydrolase|nr:ureidoglycolate lyase [Chloroflexota bacterium]
MTATSSRTVKVKAEPLTAEAYAPFGEIVDVGRTRLHCGEGQYTARLMTLEPAPTRVKHINRHPDHVQLFVPLDHAPMLLVVAPAHVPGDAFDPESVRAFVNDGSKAFTFGLNVWHIAPRGLADGARVINVQGSRYQELTELIDFEQLTGAVVEIER